MLCSWTLNMIDRNRWFDFGMAMVVIVLVAILAVAARDARRPALEQVVVVEDPEIPVRTKIGYVVRGPGGSMAVAVPVLQ